MQQVIVKLNAHKTYDLGGNVTEIKFYDVDGYAYTLTQTFAQGYQITDFSVSADSSVTSSTSGSFTYDTNNNILTTKEFNASRTSSGKQLDYRGTWTFTYDRANRLKSYTNSNSGGSRGNVWYDSKGKVWQRWNDQVIGGAWDGSLKRYVYDGGQLGQEHLWDVMEDQGSWVYTYNDIDRDYLRHQGGIRQREGTAASYNDFYLQKSGAAIEIKTQRDQASATIARAERTQSLNQMAGTTFTDISNLATSNSAIAMYGGGTSGGTGGFDGLLHRGGRYYLAGLGRFTSRMGNNAYIGSASVSSGISTNSQLRSTIVTGGISAGSGCGTGNCGITGAPSNLLTIGPITPVSPGPNYRGPGFPEFMDLRCKKCTCDFLNPSGGWGCFTPEEMDIYKPVLCMAVVFDCNQCNERCPGMPPIPKSTPGSWWPGIFTGIPEGGLRIFKKHDDIVRPPWWRRPSTYEINYCWEAALKACTEEYEELWDEFGEIMKNSRFLGCAILCLHLAGQEYFSCVATCAGIVLTGIHMAFLRSIRALIDAIGSRSFEYCICPNFVDCIANTDDDRHRAEQCCNELFHGGDHSDPVDVINRCYMNMEGGALPFS